MNGDIGDFISRLRRVLPLRWFADTASLADAILAGLASAWSAVYALISVVRAQTRLQTATSTFIDMIGADFFGQAFPRRDGEVDGSYQTRLGLELLRPRCTRAAMVAALLDLTGQIPQVFEPSLPNDTGGYNLGGIGYGVTGGWGNLGLSYQSFVTAYRPRGTGIASVAGYATGGWLTYGSLAMQATPVTDADIYATAAAVVPAGYVAWVQIQG